jgi:hypothetical protein
MQFFPTPSTSCISGPNIPPSPLYFPTSSIYIICLWHGIKFQPILLKGTIIIWCIFFATLQFRQDKEIKEGSKHLYNFITLSFFMNVILNYVVPIYFNLVTLSNSLCLYLYLPISETPQVALKTSGYSYSNETNYLESSHQGIQRAINPFWSDVNI